MTHREKPQCSDCGKRASGRELGPSRLCIDCREPRLQAAIADLLDGGLSRKQAAAKHGLSVGYLDKRMHQRGIRTGRRSGWRLTEETRRRQSEARRRTAQRVFLDMPLPATKRCFGPCGKIKERKEFYTLNGETRADDGRRSKLLSPWCKFCTRERVKAYRLSLPPEVRRQKDRERMERYVARHGIERLREDQRFRKQRQRERAGVERKFAKGKLGRTSQRLQDDVKLPLAPFQDWIRERARFYADVNDEWMVGYRRPDQVLGIGALATVCHVSERTLSKFLVGYETLPGGGRKDLTGVPLDTVDSCLTNEGSTFLFELYAGDEYAYSAEEELLVAA